MRILDQKNNRALNSILIMLTPGEASELVDKMKSLDSGSGDHIHVNDPEYKREITLATYTDRNLHFFAQEIQDLIKLS